jgi:hypothetical protein
LCKKKGDNYYIVISLSDLDWTNFYKIYGRFEEIGLLEVEAVFHWLYEFGLDVLLGIYGKLLNNLFEVEKFP